MPIVLKAYLEPSMLVLPVFDQLPEQDSSPYTADHIIEGVVEVGQSGNSMLQLEMSMGMGLMTSCLALITPRKEMGSLEKPTSCSDHYPPQHRCPIPAPFGVRQPLPMPWGVECLG